MRSIYVAWLDPHNKWHCWDIAGDMPLLGFRNKQEALEYYERDARIIAKSQVERVKHSWVTDDYAIAAYCIHSTSRYQAVKMAKGAYRERLLNGRVTEGD